MPVVEAEEVERAEKCRAERRRKTGTRGTKVTDLPLLSAGVPDDRLAAQRGGHEQLHAAIVLENDRCGRGYLHTRAHDKSSHSIKLQAVSISR